MILVEEAIFSGFISKVVNDITDVSDIKNKILNAVKNKNNKHQNVEIQIYNVIVDVLNKFISNQYRDNQDELYGVAEKLFKRFKAGEGYEAIKSCLQTSIVNVNEDEYERFKILLYETLGRNEYNELYHAIILLLLDQSGKFDRSIEEKLNEILQKLDSKKLVDDEERRFKQTVESRTQEYVKKWNANMFLNNFSEWERKQVESIKLSDVYLEKHLPHFLYEDNEEIFCNMSKLLSEYVLNNSNDNKMLLILGQPGIGKSTLITWITANFKKQVDNILVYQFASDLKNLYWQNVDISEKLLERIGFSYNELDGKILILDGFDEIDIWFDRKIVLDRIYEKLIYKKYIKNFTLIITCRENYIYNIEELSCNYVILQPWSEEQIQSFYNIYCQKNNNKASDVVIQNIIKHKDILGVPLILYMALALNITIEKEGSIVDIYDKIFSLKGGIYDRCIDNKKFADQHRIGETKEQIHQVSREIAFWMFENDSEQAIILQKDYQRICKEITTNQGNLEEDFIIGNFYKLKHCDGFGTNELCFVHRTIYEYFVIEYIFNSMCKAVESSEKLAGVFGYFLKKGLLSYTMCNLLKYKIENSELNDNFNIISEAFELMLQNGMTYYTDYLPKTAYKNIISCEMNVFVNMLEILHLWNKKSFKFNNSICKYLKHNETYRLNLRAMDLSGADSNGANLARADLTRADLAGAYLSCSNLTGANLTEADLTGTNLIGAHLSGANLKKSYLIGTDLRGADLTGADLREINLRGTELTGTIFDENQINYLKNTYDLSKVIICLKTGEVVSYMEYSERIAHKEQADYFNGTKYKQVNSVYDSVRIDVPQDCNINFAPQVVKKHQESISSTRSIFLLPWRGISLLLKLFRRP